jgi:hypothetical protein
MIRRKKPSAQQRRAVRYTTERSAPAKTETRPARRTVVIDRAGERDSRCYEIAYTISNGYTSDRAIVMP